VHGIGVLFPTWEATPTGQTGCSTGGSRAGSWEYRVLEAGCKFNLPDILAAVGLAQLRKCDRFHQMRRSE